MNNPGGGENPLDRIIRTLQSVKQSPGAGKQTPAGKKRVLTDRSRLLARSSDGAEEEAVDELELLEFYVGGERFGFDSSQVEEVALVGEVTPLPGAPPFILGLFNHRGKILALNDIRKVIGTADAELKSIENGIIVSRDGIELAVAADGIPEISQYRTGEIKTVHLQDVRNDLLLGVVHESLIVNIEKIMTDKLLLVREENPLMDGA